MTEPDNPDDDPRKVNASPAKRFFIGMLVRDIELLPAVLDLVDNSVDGARRMRGDDRYDGLRVELGVGAERFHIVDNCGGIDLAHARNYAFRFGRPEDFDPTPGSVGQFGVGMKRALFKLGKEFLIDSRTQSTRFVLHVDVDEWAQEQGSDWSFFLTEADRGYHPDNADAIGTEIVVDPLLPNVAQDFGSSQTLGALRDQLRLRHTDAMQRGMQISLNGEAVKPFLPMLPASENLVPLHRTFTLEEDGGVVNVRIYAGAAPPDRDAPADDDRGEDFQNEPDAGWYIFCNNRLLVAADRSLLTGWGNGLPIYHPQFRQFRGFVYIDSLKSDLLPWNTTKTGIDQDSRVWRKISSEMLQAGNDVIRLLNRVKNERRATEDTVGQPISQAISAAPQIPLARLPTSEKLTYPEPAAPPVRETQRIAYTVDRERFNNAAAVLGTTTIADVGRRTFDYFYDNQVDEGL